MMNHLCPGCGSHCYLDEPQCERGAEYTKNGVMPPRKPRLDENGNVRKPPEKKLKYLVLSRDEKILWNLRSMGEQIDALGDTVPEDMFACLREDDRTALLMLLERVKHSWHHKSK